MNARASSILILATRILLVLAALGAVVAGFSVANRATPSSGTSSSPSTYVCPMHPEVVATQPIDCPICRMRLEPAKPQLRPGNESKKSPDGRDTERPTGFTLPKKAEFRRFDATSRVLVRPMSLEMRAHASAESDDVGTALYHREESELLEPGEVGLFSPAMRATTDDPRGVEVQVSDDPPLRWDERTALVRFVAKKGGLRPGETGSVKFPTRVRQGLTVRASAIVEAPDGPHVFVTSDDRRTLTRRRVEIGNVIYDAASILSGLRENEYVVSKFAFLLDVERRAIEGMTP
jgi:hypothetical protein